MSFPGKENLIYFEGLEKSQTRIWPDACDTGIEVTNCKGLKDAARENLMALMKCYAYKLFKPETARFPYDTDFDKCSLTTIFIPFEFDEGAYVGVELKVDFQTFTRCGKSREYLNISIRPDRKAHADIVGKLFKI